MILSRIIEEKRRYLERVKKQSSLREVKERARSICVKSSFRKSIARPHHINLIAEIKKASPSRGILRGDFNPAKIAVTYQANGASAISVLTDERFFDGKLSYIQEVKDHVSIPVFRKDFIIDEYQLYESVVAQADAILLISGILTKVELSGFYATARELGLDVIVEVHNEEHLEKALEADVDIIGINNRDLTTFKVDLQTTQRLARQIPQSKIIVSESGIRTYEDVMFLRSLGVHAVLIGEAFMVSDDIAAKMRQIMKF
ncbi:MAG: indole-3-glycerol phosphate synthase TrpC [Candidatus Omnitrophota bacterium]